MAVVVLGNDLEDLRRDWDDAYQGQLLRLIRIDLRAVAVGLLVFFVLGLVVLGRVVRVARALGLLPVRVFANQHGVIFHDHLHRQLNLRLSRRKLDHRVQELAHRILVLCLSFGMLPVHSLENKLVFVSLLLCLPGGLPDA